MKKCKRCDEVKKEMDFYRNHDECKTCWNAYCSLRRKAKIEADPDYLEKRRKYLQEWRKQNPDKDKEYSKKALEKNKDKISERRKSPEARKKMNDLVKDWRQRNKERFLETEKLKKSRNRIKLNAVSLVGKHLRRGHLVRSSKCEKCGTLEGKMEAHHDDYNKPLDVRWLCKVCHCNEHGKLLDLKNVS